MFKRRNLLLCGGANGGMASKRYRQEEWLREKYVNEEWTLSEMGDECGVSRPTVAAWMDKYDIDRRDRQAAQRQSGDHTDAEWLREQYHGEGRTMRDMAGECGVTPATIMNWMDRHGIPKRTPQEHLEENHATYIETDRGYRRIDARRPNGSGQDTLYVHQLLAIAAGYDPHLIFSGDYHVHHKNRHKFDNRIENLELLTNEEHKRIHANERDRAESGEFL